MKTIGSALLSAFFAFTLASIPGCAVWEEQTKPERTKITLKAGTEEGSIDIPTFEEIMATEPDSIYLIDVRNPDEFAAGSLKTAVNIPLNTLEEKIEDLPTDRPIVFICRTGKRSGKSYDMVKSLRPSMKNVYCLKGVLSIKKDGSFTITEPN